MTEIYKLLHNLEDIPYSRIEWNSYTWPCTQVEEKTCKKDIRKNLFLSESYFSMEPVAKSSGTFVTAPTLNAFTNRLDKFKLSMFPAPRN